MPFTQRMSVSARLVLIAVLLLAPFGAAQARPAPHLSGMLNGIIYVDAGAAGLNNGTSWENAFVDLQSALAAQPGGFQIWVKAGTYKPTTTTDRSISFEMGFGLSVYGGFNGTETLLSQRDPVLNETILTGDIGIAGYAFDNSYHVVRSGSLITEIAILDGFTITGGYNDLTAPLADRFGAGMINLDSGPRLENLVFVDNHAVGAGGMFNFQSAPLLTNVRFINNTAISGGGGMYNDSTAGGPSLVNVTFTGNSADGGGGMVNHNSSPILNNVIFENNTATTMGGAMVSWMGTPSLHRVRFISNSAPVGGGLHLDSGAELVDVVFRENRAADGAALAIVSGSASLLNVTFDSNISTGSGGGLHLSASASPALANVTFYNNQAASGGGLYSGSGSQFTVDNTTFSRNSAAAGAAIAAVGSGTRLLRSSIIYGNIGPDPVNGTVTYESTLTEGGADPLLGTLQDNGGFASSMALGPGSSAIDAGNDLTCPTVDARGIHRPQGAHCDQGAYEAAGAGAQIWDTTLGSYYFDFLGDERDLTYATGVALDAGGDVYVLGFSLLSWGSPLRAHSGGSGGCGDVFVARLDPNGTLLWNTFLGASGCDYSYQLALDGAGNIYVIGESQASWGTPLNPFSLSANGFIARLDPNGALVWNSFGRDWSGIAIDSGGGLYLTGGGGYVAKFSSSGTLQWETLLASGGTIYGLAIDVDSAGTPYVSGRSNFTWGTPVNSFTPGPSTVYDDAFVARLDSSGALVWNTFMGSSDNDFSTGIAIDDLGNVYLSGVSITTWGTPVRSHSGGYADGFAARLDAITGERDWSTFLGGDGYDRNTGVSLDADGNVYVAGESMSAWGDPVLAAHGAEEAFVARLEPATGSLSWHSFLGSEAHDYMSRDVAVSPNGSLFVAGKTMALNDDPQNYQGGNDVYVVKLSAVDAPPVTISGNAGAAGVELSDFSRGLHAFAGQSGDYTLLVPHGWGGTISPFNLDTSFDPGSRSYSDLVAGQTGQDFTASSVPVVSITGSTAAGVTLSYKSGGPQSALSGIDGSYTIQVPFGWSGTVTPSKTGLTFLPALRSYARLASGQVDQDFRITVGCYQLTLSHTGSGADPAASPQNSTGCTSGTYISGESISLSASPAASYHVSGWTGTEDDTTTALENTLTMPAEAHSVSVAYAADMLTLQVKSQAVRDGWVQESTETSSAGGTKNNIGAVINLGDSAYDRQFRGILSFNTGLPAGAVISSVQLQLCRKTIVGTDPFMTHGDLKLEIRKGYFGSTSSLQLVDFNAAATISSATLVDSVPVGCWYTAVLPDTAYSAINLSGLTQIRLRFTMGDNDDRSADQVRFYSGDAAVDLRPLLTIEYTLP